MPVAGKNLFKTKAATIDISENATTSTIVETDGLLVSGIIFPAAMTGSTVTFLVSSTNSGGSFKALKETDGTSVSYTVSACLLYTSPSPRDQRGSRMPSSA